MDISTAHDRTRTARRSRGWLRWIGAGLAGMAAWIALCCVTAMLDPRPMGVGLARRVRQRDRVAEAQVLSLPLGAMAIYAACIDTGS